MVREPYVGDIKIIYSNAGTVQDEINLPQGRMTRMGWHIGEIGVFQTCRGEKKIQFPAAPKGIEVTGNDDFLIGLLRKVMQLFKLVLPMPVLERQMNDENGDGLQIGLNDQPFYSLFEIVEAKIFNALLG